VKRALATEAVGAGTTLTGYDRAKMQRKMAQVEWLHVYVKFAVVRTSNRHSTAARFFSRYNSASSVASALAVLRLLNLSVANLHPVSTLVLLNARTTAPTSDRSRIVIKARRFRYVVLDATFRSTLSGACFEASPLAKFDLHLMSRLNAMLTSVSCHTRAPTRYPRLSHWLSGLIRSCFGTCSRHTETSVELNWIRCIRFTFALPPCHV
jgi:hypothetical protein